MVNWRTACVEEQIMRKCHSKKLPLDGGIVRGIFKTELKTEMLLGKEIEVTMCYSSKAYVVAT